jgi:hypothetical protein
LGKSKGPRRVVRAVFLRIAYDPKSVLEGMNAPSSEDLQMERWVKNQANRTDRERRIDYVTEPSLLWELEGME